MDLYMYKSGSMLETVLARTMRKKLPKIMASDAWLWLSRGVIMELLEDTNLQVTEQLLTGIVKWCRANSDSELEAIDKFQYYFAAKLLGENMKEKLPEFMASEAWLWLPESKIMELVEDTNINASEGQLFTGIIKWCRANSETEQEAIDKFKNCFVDTIFGKNISRWQWLDLFLPLDIFIFIPDKQFRQWSSEIVIKNNCKEATQVNNIETSA